MVNSSVSKFSGRLAKSFSIALLASIFLLMTVSGCLTTKGLPNHNFTVKYYGDCYAPVQQLRDNESALKADVMKGAAAGALAGAAAGLLAGGGDWRYILGGAVIGAAAGATITYLVSSEVQEKDQAARFAAYSETMDVDIKNIELANQAGRLAAECYDRQYNQLERDFRAGRVSKPEMLERLAEIRAGIDEAVEIMQYYQDITVANIKTYDEIIVAEEKRAPEQDKATPQRRQAVSAKKKKIETFSAATDTQMARLRERSRVIGNRQNAVNDAITPSQAYLDDAILAAFEFESCIPCSRS
jgi:hypothetical protein